MTTDQRGLRSSAGQLCVGEVEPPLQLQGRRGKGDGLVVGAGRHRVTDVERAGPEGGR